MRPLLCIAALLLSATQANAQARRPRLAYGIVECAAWPWVGTVDINADLNQLKKLVMGKRLRVLMTVKARGIRAYVEAIRLGTNPQSGKPVWALRGPKKLSASLIAAGCVVTEYKDALALPAAKRDWIKARSTCVGTASKGGKTVTIWPCGAAGYTEIAVTGLAPRVMRGGQSVRQVAGVDIGAP